jgi:hypothetical protein
LPTPPDLRRERPGEVPANLADATHDVRYCNALASVTRFILVIQHIIVPRMQQRDRGAPRTSARPRACACVVSLSPISDDGPCGSWDDRPHRRGRERLGIRQSDLARRTGMSVRTLHSWEWDNTVSKDGRLERLADGFGQELLSVTSEMAWLSVGMPPCGGVPIASKRVYRGGSLNIAPAQVSLLP